ncbi:hypothetical protein GCK72_022527 [Caenorhabditis remanei]|uniref:Protein kinase domain-containing protein n=2 Tax=Caenorhabditis remanei TaxID=31234 RepID=E3NL19_CAERE|nr:hypothetical protein GCK72_022527 [Caenorhabditis remanei]EFP03983.1 hypothetical protein CRE_30252 [Caenorhabditis remanei]KAF1746075.1 hypothetical protein GCK72_022527 [Caenorhabditis remanei]
MSSPPQSDSSSAPAPPSSAPAPPSSTENSSNASELFPPPPAHSAEFIPDKSEYESEEEERENLGAFQFRGTSYRIKKILGEGTFGKVVLVAAESKRLYAAKFFTKDNNDADGNDASIGSEERVYKHLGTSVHNSVAQVIGIDYVDWSPDGCNKKIILMPLLGISIGDMVEQAQKMDVENRAALGEDSSSPKVSFRIKKIQEIGRNVLSGLKFLLDHGVYHLDLKPDNVMFSAQNTFRVILNGSTHSIIAPKSTQIQISDMGLAKVFSDMGESSEIVQSPMYRAPEIFAGGRPNKCSDLWSFCIMMLQMYTCTDEYWPDHADHPQVQYFRNLQHGIGQRMTAELWDEVAKIKGGKKVRGALKLYDNGQAEPNTPPLMSLKRSYHADHLFEFLQYAMVLDWNVRPTVEELLNHDFFKKN